MEEHLQSSAKPHHQVGLVERGQSVRHNFGKRQQADWNIREAKKMLTAGQLLAHQVAPSDTRESNYRGKRTNLMSLLTNPDEALKNHILASLSHEAYVRLRKELRTITVPLGYVIYEPGQEMDYVYFPTTSIVSFLYVTEIGATAEIAMVGNDGLVGVASFMGGASTPNRTTVRNAGRVVMMRAKVLKDEFMRGGRFQNLLLRYTQSLITQISQTAVCNRLHSVDQRFCRWLLQSYDRLASSNLIMTQELIANMLGVRREGISHAAKRLQNMGLIRYVRGGITILDRPGLEESACECYQVVRGEYQRLIG